MDWNFLFFIYAVFWGMLGWPIEKSLKRVLGPKIWWLGIALLLLNLLILLWQWHFLFAGDNPIGLGLRFVLYPALVLGLLSCCDAISHYASRFREKER